MYDYYGYNDFYISGLEPGQFPGFALIFLLIIWLVGKFAIKTSMYDLEKGCELQRKTVGIVDPFEDITFQQCKLTAEKNIKTWRFVNKIVPYLILFCVIFYLIRYKR
jgi:hypothetical protein